MLSPEIQANLAEQEALGGINLSRIPPGTTVRAVTKNTEYVIETTTTPKKVWMEGGTYLPDRRQVHFNGSTWGGSMLKMDWIGFGMRMEFVVDNKAVTTTPVSKASVHGPGWEYELTWQ